MYIQDHELFLFESTNTSEAENTLRGFITNTSEAENTLRGFITNTSEAENTLKSIHPSVTISTGQASYHWTLFEQLVWTRETYYLIMMIITTLMAKVVHEWNDHYQIGA